MDAPSKDGVKQNATGSELEALKKCLAENKGDLLKCKPQMEAFKASSSSFNRRKPTSPYYLYPYPRPDFNSNLLTEI